MRLNAGLPVWHVSVSVWSRRNQRLDLPRIAETAAVRLLAGVGGDREWWLWNPDVRVGHLRVALTSEESEAMPVGCAVHDAGDSGPERARTRR
jgi:hypothetical protein